MTVDDLHERMSNQEFIGWMIYYGRRRQEAQLSAASR
jgi:hypothetical protein